MLGITIRRESPAARVRRLLRCLPWVVLALALRLGNRHGWAHVGAIFSLAVFSIELLSNAIQFARTSPEERPFASLSSWVLIFLFLFALSTAPILSSAFAGRRLGWLAFMLAVTAAAWISSAILTSVVRSTVSFVVSRRGGNRR